MRILNLYAGIGGNRKLWGDEHEITAVEYDPAIAAAYQDRYTNDTVIVGDAKQYLLDQYKEFDFIWASPPCQTHSEIRRCGVKSGQYEAKMIDMTLYEIVIFLQTYAFGKFIVENVIPYYSPLIRPTVKIDRHLYWSNFTIAPIEVKKDRIHCNTSPKDFDALGLKDTGIKNKVQVMRNQVNYETGLYILECAMDSVKHKQGGLFDTIGGAA